MKRTVALFLIALTVFLPLFVFSSCSEGGETNLTMNNVNTYFSFYTGGEATGNLTSTSSGSYYGKDGLKVYCRVFPISNNFIYNNVIIKVKLSGTYKYFDTAESAQAHHEVFIDEPESFETTLVINVSIAGSGEVTQNYTMPSGKLIPNFNASSGNNYFVCNYEILSVSGTVEKA